MKILDGEFVPQGLPPKDTGEDMLMERKYILEDSPMENEATKVVCRLSGKPEDNVGLMQVSLPSTFEGKTHSMVIPTNIFLSRTCGFPSHWVLDRFTVLIMNCHLWIRPQIQSKVVGYPHNLCVTNVYPWCLCWKAYGFITRFSVPFHWSMNFLLCQYHADFITMALQHNLESCMVVDPALFFLLGIALAVLGPLNFYINLKILSPFLWGMPMEFQLELHRISRLLLVIVTSYNTEFFQSKMRVIIKSSVLLNFFLWYLNVLINKPSLTSCLGLFLDVFSWGYCEWECSHDIFLSVLVIGI